MALCDCCARFKNGSEEFLRRSEVSGSDPGPDFMQNDPPSILEQMVMARCDPIMHLYRLKSPSKRGSDGNPLYHQLAMSGFVAYIMKDVDTWRRAVFPPPRPEEFKSLVCVKTIKDGRPPIRMELNPLRMKRLFELRPLSLSLSLFLASFIDHSHSFASSSSPLTLCSVNTQVCFLNTALRITLL